MNSLWFDPRRLLMAWARGLLLFALPIGFIAGAFAVALGIYVLHLGNTFSVSASLRLLPVAKPINVSADLEPYSVPEFQPAEVLTWFYRTEVLEAAYARSGRSDGIKVFKTLINVTYNKDAKLFLADYAGATSAASAASGLGIYLDVVMDQARAESLARINRDRDFYSDRQRLAQQDLDVAKDGLAHVGQDTGMVDRNEEILLRMKDAADANEKAAAQEAELTYLDRRLQDLPGLIANLPQEVPGHRSLAQPLNLKLDALKDQERRYAAIYTEGNPLLVAVRDQIKDLKTEMAAETTVNSPDGMDRNPVVDTLRQEQATLELDRPRLVAEVERSRQHRDEARAALAEMPKVLARFDDAASARAQAEQLVQRIGFRLAEINMARDLTRGQLEIFETPRAELATEKKLGTKLATVGGAAFAAGFFAVAAVLLLRLLRDGRIPTAGDARAASGATLAETLPVPISGLGDDAARAWLQRVTAALTGQAATVLVTAETPRAGARFAGALARQMARSGLETFLVADSVDLGVPDPGTGMSGVLDQTVHPRDAVVALADHLGWLPIGDAMRVADQAASGKIEQLLKELAGKCESLVVCLPFSDPGIEARAASALDAVVVVIDPAAATGLGFVRRVRGHGRLIALAVVAGGP